VQGVVKAYDPTTGYGVIAPDDGSGEVLLAPGALAGSVFRTLRQGQRIVFDVHEEDGRTLATRVRLGSEEA
jgi:CspA family cold shock protein